jgi:hypothetical protein
MRRTDTAVAATTLLAKIDQVAHWLPKCDPGRDVLIRSVADIQTRFEHGPLSRNDVINFQMNVWRLDAGPFKSLLKCRTEQFKALCDAELQDAESHAR